MTGKYCYHGFILTCTLFTTPALSAGGSLEHSARALQHSVNAVAYSVTAGAQLVSGAAAIPLGFAGAVGGISQDLSEELWDAANAPIGTPLPITDEVVTVGPPPSEAIRDKTGNAR